MKENKSLALKGNGGITLIALVITIIVLIILAGISIAMISGQDGILNRASQSAAYNALGAAKDQCAMEAAEVVNQYYEDKYVKNSATTDVLDDLIITKLNNNANVIKALGTNGTCTAQAGADGIVLTYSDGTNVTGKLSDGVITWGKISND